MAKHFPGCPCFECSKAMDGWAKNRAHNIVAAHVLFNSGRVSDISFDPNLVTAMLIQMTKDTLSEIAIRLEQTISYNNVKHKIAMSGLRSELSEVRIQLRLSQAELDKRRSISTVPDTQGRLFRGEE